MPGKRNNSHNQNVNREPLTLDGQGIKDGFYPGMAAAFPGFMPAAMPSMGGLGFYPYTSPEAMYQSFLALSLLMPPTASGMAGLSPAMPFLAGLPGMSGLSPVSQLPNLPALPPVPLVPPMPPTVFQAPAFAPAAPATSAALGAALAAPTPTLMGYLPLSHPGDRKGILHWIATDGGTRPWTCPVASGKIQVAASTLSRGTAGDIVAPTFTNQICYTQDSASSWMRVDLLDNWVVPEAYVMAHQAVVGGKPGEAFDGHFMRNWTLWASTDGMEWVPLRVHVQDTTLSVSNPYAAFAIPGPGQPFRHFCVQIDQAGNSEGSHSLVMSCFELYGFVYQCQGSAALTNTTLPPSDPKGAAKGRAGKGGKGEAPRPAKPERKNSGTLVGGRPKPKAAPQPAAAPRPTAAAAAPVAPAPPPPQAAPIQMRSALDAAVAPAAASPIQPGAIGPSAEQVQAAMFAALSAINSRQTTAGPLASPAKPAAAKKQEPAAVDAQNSTEAMMLRRFLNQLNSAGGETPQEAGEKFAIRTLVPKTTAVESVASSAPPARTALPTPGTAEVVVISSLQPPPPPAPALPPSPGADPASQPATPPLDPAPTPADPLQLLALPLSGSLTPPEDPDSPPDSLRLPAAAAPGEAPAPLEAASPTPAAPATPTAPAPPLAAVKPFVPPSLPGGIESPNADSTGNLRSFAEDLLALIKPATDAAAARPAAPATAATPAAAPTPSSTASTGRAEGDADRRARLGRMMLRFLESHYGTD